VATSGVPLPLVVGVVVFLLVIAAMCGAIAIWTILHDLRVRPGQAPPVQAPSRMITASPVELRPPPPQLPVSPIMTRRRMAPPGVPWFPAPLPRGTVLGTLMPERDEDDDDEHDYTEVDDGVTIVRSIRLAARR
jgi:hypothetical protein